MKELLATIIAFLVVILIVVAVGWFAQGNDLAMTYFFAPKYEAVRRTTFEQSKAYRQGMAQELAQYYHEYQKATPSQQAAIAAMIRHEYADVDPSSLPSYLRDFLATATQTQIRY